MSFDRLIHKAEHLLNQERFAEAQKEIKSYLSSDPENAHALSLLAQAYLGLGQHAKADQIVDRVLALEPSSPSVLYLKAVTLFQLGQNKKSLKFIENVLAFNPSVAEAHGLKSLILFNEADFEESLTASNAGLQIDPENEMCLNQRSRALLKLGRKEEQIEADRQALKSNPMNPNTHATVGYSELEKGNISKAKEHFREALRIHPNHEYARYGMLQAIKSSNLYYRLVMMYFFWMQGLKSQVRWLVVIGGYILIQFLDGVSNQLGPFKPAADVVLVLYMIFAISTWIIGPVSNVFLFFHSFGKFVLSDEEKKTAKMCAALLGFIIIGGSLMLAFDNEQLQWHNLGVYLLSSGIALIVVISSVESAKLEKSKKNLRMVGSVFGVMCGLLILLGVSLPALAFGLFNLMIYGFIGFQFYANTQH